jgi:Flp pilus assembly protein TadG
MRHSRGSNRRGTVAALAALLIAVLLGMVAFAIDSGYIVHARTRLQRAADACALAAAAELPDQNAATLAARATALDNHEAIGSGLELGDDDSAPTGHLDPLEVEYGYWNRQTATFTSPPPYSHTPNAVRVTLARSEATGNPLPLTFGRVLGRSEADVSASAIALSDHWLCGPFVGIDWLTVQGTAGTDSYSSEEGDYVWSDARDYGSICSDGPITVGGDPLIRGDARAGKAYGVTLNGDPIITGSIGTRLKPLNMAAVDATDAALVNDNDQIPLLPRGGGWTSPLGHNGDFSLEAGETVFLPPGTYYFRNFKLVGGSTFNVYGPTTIYISGNMSRQGGAWVNNYTKKASNLAFLLTGGTVNVTSDNDFYGTIYAPHSSVSLGGTADLFGAVLGQTLKVTGTGAGHYDEALCLTDVEFPQRIALVD